MRRAISNPVFNGWCSDPSILRVDGDYYIASSTFEWMPGIHLFHSRDLAHWEQLPGALTDALLDLEGLPASCGVWAPNLTWYQGRFYLAYAVVHTAASRMKDPHVYITTAEDIRGPWTQPVFVSAIGFDPSVFHDEDGRVYLIDQTMERRTSRKRFAGVSVTELDPVSLKPLGLSRVVFSGTDRGTTEGPNVLKKDGWYYITAAEGGTSFGHCVTISRSRSLWGPYEVDPQNPVLTSAGTDCALQRAGHGQFVTDPQGNWYMAHLCARPLEGKWSILGRECAIQNIMWTEDGWPRVTDLQGCPMPGAMPQLAFLGPDVPNQPWPEAPVRTDFCRDIPVQWMTLRRGWLYCGMSLEARPGWLRIQGGHSLCSTFRQHLLARRVSTLHCRLTALMDFRAKCANHTAGMVVLYNNMNWHYLFVSADDESQPTLCVSTCENGQLTDLWEEVLPGEESRWTLQAVIEGGKLHFRASWGDSPLQGVGPALDMRIISDEHVSGNGFTSAMIGLCCQDLQGNGCHADFAWADYEDLPEGAECTVELAAPKRYVDP